MLAPDPHAAASRSTTASGAPARGTLSAEDVVDAAVALLQDFGVGDLSMRRVAAQLGVQASALYWHVPNKQTLLARVADRIVADVEHAVTVRDLRTVAELDAATTAALLRHRDGADVVISALALGLGGARLHRLFVSAAAQENASPEHAEAELARVLGAATLRQQRAQAQALGVDLGPDFQARLRREEDS